MPKASPGALDVVKLPERFDNVSPLIKPVTTTVNKGSDVSLNLFLLSTVTVSARLEINPSVPEIIALVPPVTK